MSEKEIESKGSEKDSSLDRRQRKRADSCFCWDLIYNKNCPIHDRGKQQWIWKNEPWEVTVKTVSEEKILTNPYYTVGNEDSVARKPSLIILEYQIHNFTYPIYRLF